jgi:hypothetical protein
LARQRVFCRFSYRGSSGSPTGAAPAPARAPRSPHRFRAGSFRAGWFRSAARSIYAALSALVAAAPAPLGVGHGEAVALLFVVSFGLLIASLTELSREIRVYMANMHLE